MHNHKHCHEHILKHCKVCDTVYCEKCGREWKHRYYQYTYTYPYISWEDDKVNSNFIINTATKFSEDINEIQDDKVWTRNHTHE